MSGSRARWLIAGAMLATVAMVGTSAAALPDVETGVYAASGALSIKEQTFSASGTMTLTQGSGVPEKGTYRLNGTFSWPIYGWPIYGCDTITPGQGMFSFIFDTGMSHALAVQVVCQAGDIAILGAGLDASSHEAQVLGRFTLAGDGIVSLLCNG